MSDKTEPTTEDQQPEVSKKRQITAAVTSTTVTVLLGLASTAVIELVGQRVKNAIAPKTDTE